MRSLIVLAAFCWSAVAAPLPKEVKRGDPFAGTWKLAKTVINGRPYKDTEHDVFWMIDEKHEVTLNVTAKKDAPPPAPKPMPIGWVMTTAAPTSTQLQFDTARHEIDYKCGDNVQPGRYEVSGDTLTIVLSLPGSTRPGTVRDTENTRSWMLERVAK